MQTPRLLKFMYYLTDCGPLPKPVGSEVFTETGTTVGSLAIYTCLDGYSLNESSGNRMRTCSINGSWEGTPPTCEPVGKFWKKIVNIGTWPKSLL